MEANHIKFALFISNCFSACRPSWCSIVVCEGKRNLICFSSVLSWIRNRRNVLFAGTIEDVEVQLTRFKSSGYVSIDLPTCYFLAPAVNLFNNRLTCLTTGVHVCKGT